MDSKYFITNKKILELASNLLNENGENNQKLLKILLTGFNLNIKLYEDMLKLNYLDDLEGVMLDLYAKMLNLYRNGLNDQDFRALIKSMLMLKSNGVSFNNLVMAISTFLDIKPTLVKITESGNDKNTPSRHIKLVSIDETVDIKKLLAFAISIKAAGIIIDCWEYTIVVKYYVYDESKYDEDAVFVEKKFRLDCTGAVLPITNFGNVDYEYDLHEYDLNELTEIND